MTTDETVSKATRRTIEAYWAGFEARDLSSLPIADDVLVKTPVQPDPIRGLDALRPFLEALFSQFERVDIHRTIVDGEFACVVFDYCLPERAPIPMVDIFRVVDAEVVEIDAYFDTKLITA